MRLKKLVLSIYFIYALLGIIDPDVHAIQKPDGPDKTIKIGLLIHENTSMAAKRGAELAIRKANENGGFNGKSFLLVVKSMEGPWGTGSKQAVSLIFEDQVCALMGSPDGRNGHLVEQVATKTRIIFISTWASDPTLAQAFVPWYFSCVPNDLQQADSFIEEVYNKRKLTKIAAVSDEGYDSKLAVESFLKRVKSAGIPDLLQLSYNNQDQDFSGLIEKISKAGAEGVILFGKPSASIRLIRQLEKRKMNLVLFGALSLLDEDDMSSFALKDYKNIVLISSGGFSGSKDMVFKNEYKRTYGKFPGAVAEYSYDGMNMIIEAVRKAGPDHENIQKALAKMHYEGVTGAIQFDDKGKRMGTPGLMEIKNGVLVSVKR